MNDAEIILSANAVKKTFTSPDGIAVDVLRGANLEIARGESVSLRGESGAGKTTFLNIIACLESPDSGEIFWNGGRCDNLSNSRQAAVRGAFMGFVFQNYCLVPELNAYENVCLASRIIGRFDKVARMRAHELLERVGLKDRQNHLPSQLSGGEKQRVAVARAVVNNPDIILADEPTGNLDESTGAEVMDMFLNLCAERRTALLLITHNPEFASRALRRVKLSGGLIA